MNIKAVDDVSFLEILTYEIFPNWEIISGSWRSLVFSGPSSTGLGWVVCWAVVTDARGCTMHGSEGNSGIKFSSLMVPERNQLLILLGEPSFVFEISND